MTQREQRALKPAEQCIWYVLATIAGEALPGDFDAEIAELNRLYWNGLMHERIARYGVLAELFLDQPIDIAPLDDLQRGRIRAALDSRGFAGVEIPPLDAAIDFSNVHFSNVLWLDGFVFAGDTTFERALFSGDGNLFSNTVFVTDATFQGAEFGGFFIAQSATFGGSTNFTGVTFRDHAGFSQSEFKTTAQFDNTDFLEDALFDRCKFLDDVSFMDGTFKKRGDFRAARLEGQTRFLRTEFAELVPEFFDVTLNEYTDWYRCEVAERSQGS